MKWGILVLLLLGIIAAVCAAMLVGAFKLDFFGGGAKAPATVEVIVAARDLQANTLITEDSFEKKTLPKTEVPAGTLAGETTIGRVPRVPILKGKLLEETLFFPKGSIQQLLATLGPGKVACTLNLRSDIPDRALLRPGCHVNIVSVITSRRTPGGQLQARPLLGNIRVIMVQGVSVLDDAETIEAALSKRTGALDVTLEVDDQQAAALNLARQEGNIGMMIRSPGDTEMPSMDTIIVDEGRIISITGQDLVDRQTRSGQNGDVSNPGSNANQTGNRSAQSEPEKRTSPPANTKVRIIHGTTDKEQEVTAPKK